jgi:hypothetical protein
MPSRALAIVNRHTGTITALNEREVTVRLDRPRTDGGKSISVRIADFPHIVRIPAHRERPFRLNVNGDSARW